MGWEIWDDEAGDGQHHEGYVIGVERVTRTDPDGWVRQTDQWRDVGADFDHASDDPAQRARRDVAHVQVACECGWRSERLLAPLGTYWAPCCVMLPTTFDHDLAGDEVTYRMWRAHIDGLGPHSLGQRGRDLLAAGWRPEPIAPIGSLRARAGEPA